MVARITLVRCEVDCAVDVDRQVGIDLDDALVTALVPVVAAPRLVAHVFNREALLIWQRDPVPRTPAALVDGPVEYVGKAICWNDELGSKSIKPLDERAGAGDQPIELVERRLEVRLGTCRGHRVVERCGLLVE